jgi:hypothetical protein
VSCYGLWADYNNIRDDPPKLIRYIAETLQILFEVALPAAILITIVVFLLLDREPAYFNYSQHLANTVALLIEYSLNSIAIRPEHAILYMFWTLIYLLFIWTVIGGKAVRNWPYDFLQVETASCFVWYPSFLFGTLFIYFWSLPLEALKRFVTPSLPCVPPLRDLQDFSSIDDTEANSDIEVSNTSLNPLSGR